MTGVQHWLVQSVRALHPAADLPPGVEIAADTTEAWRQVAGIFQLSQTDLARCVAQLFGMTVGDMTQFQPNDASLIPERMSRELGLVQLWQTPQAVCLALSNPLLPDDQLARIKFGAGRPVELVILPPDDIDTCLTRMFANANSPLANEANVIDLLAGKEDSAKSQTVRLAKALLRSAIDRKASDVHIHPFVGGGAIRFRIDGRMRRIGTIPNETLSSLTRYFKTNAGLDPNPLKPQDGRLRLRYGQREIDVRLSVLPAYDGERIVCRLLDQSRNFSLQNSRFSPTDQQTLCRLTSNSAGIVLLTGPTGSGKTSTLYALLAELNSVEVNILTIENPVEYVLPGISQVQVNEKQGLSFADTLRSILRQDPDIVLVGEIRDSETATVASQAAMTGHLVLSTLHTNNALGTLPRLLDLGLDASILADALLGVVSQRLVRCLCDDCRQPIQAPYSPTEAEFHRITGEYPASRPGGCKSCDYTGFRGRLPVIESVEMSPALRQAIVAGERRLDELARIAGSDRRSMAASAKDWIVSGKTTPAEVQTVMGLGFWRELAGEHGIGLESLSADLGQEIQSGRRMKVLALSPDTALCQTLADGLSYAVAQVADETAAAAYLKEHNDVIGLVIDSALADTAPDAWLIRLRTQLAWAGLPALFITRPEDRSLVQLLVSFHAPYVQRDAAQPMALLDALSNLLQGKR